MTEAGEQKVALITGVGRRRSIGAALAIGLARDGWDLALNYWTPYDDRVGLERIGNDPRAVADLCRSLGASVKLIEGDLSDTAAPAAIVDQARALGPLAGLVMSHAESVDSSILTTDLDSWDRHFAVNARATWLLIKAFAEQLPLKSEPGTPRASVVALTSDHTIDTCRTGRARAPSTASSRRPPSSSKTAGCARTSSTPAPSIRGGWTIRPAPGAPRRPRLVASGRQRTRRTSCASCSHPPAPGSTGKYSPVTAGSSSGRRPLRPLSGKERVTRFGWPALEYCWLCVQIRDRVIRLFDGELLAILARELVVNCSR